MVFAVAALKYVCVWILKQRGQYCNRFSLEKNISFPNVFGFACVRAGEGDFRCRIFDFGCMEARCSDAADLEKKGEKYFSFLSDTKKRT